MRLSRKCRLTSSVDCPVADNVNTARLTFLGIVKAAVAFFSGTENVPGLPLAVVSVSPIILSAGGEGTISVVKNCEVNVTLKSPV